ncbi:hypothetical protein JYU15_02300 [bacterium AH-315-I18]|nr:hypothetical protein [bacterium AH-315-I18]
MGYLRPDVQAALRCGLASQKIGSCHMNFCTTEYAMIYMVKGQAIYQDDQHSQVHLRGGMVWQRLPNRVHSVTCLESCSWYYVAVPGSVAELFQIAGISTLGQIAFHIGHHRSIIRRYEHIH